MPPTLSRADCWLQNHGKTLGHQKGSWKMWRTSTTHYEMKDFLTNKKPFLRHELLLRGGIYCPWNTWFIFFLFVTLAAFFGWCVILLCIALRLRLWVFLCCSLWHLASTSRLSSKHPLAMRVDGLMFPIQASSYDFRVQVFADSFFRIQDLKPVACLGSIVFVKMVDFNNQDGQTLKVMYSPISKQRHRTFSGARRFIRNNSCWIMHTISKMPVGIVEIPKLQYMLRTQNYLTLICSG